jgi:uncharacterized caspase-like protein
VAYRGFALVVGNTIYAYKPRLIDLPAGVSDAKAIAEILNELNYSVVEAYEVGIGLLAEKIREFKRRLPRAGIPERVVFFYSGHGARVHGVDYIIPVDARVDRGDNPRLELVSLSSILEEVAIYGAGLEVAFVNACRDDLLTLDLEEYGKYHTVMGIGNEAQNAPDNRLTRLTRRIESYYHLFSAKPGQITYDYLNEGTNLSPFGHALANNLRIAGVTLSTVGAHVKEFVQRATGGRSRGAQEPIAEDGGGGVYVWREPLVTTADGGEPGAEPERTTVNSKLQADFEQRPATAAANPRGRGRLSRF